MDTNTVKLIESLSEKLGTTAEHLWVVLVKQAPISATTMAIFYLVFAAITLWTFFLTKKLIAKDSDWFPMWFLWGFFMLVFIVGFAVDSPSILSGFLNPEYWALNECLDAMKPRK